MEMISLEVMIIEFTANINITAFALVIQSPVTVYYLIQSNNSWLTRYVI